MKMIRKGEVLERLGQGYGYSRLWVLGDLNRWVRDRVRASIPVFLEFQENDNERKWWSSVLKGACVGVTHILSTRACIINKEGYAALSAGCEDSERNGTRPFSSLRFTV